MIPGENQFSLTHAPAMKKRGLKGQLRFMSLSMVLASLVIPPTVCEAASHGPRKGYEPLGDPFYNRAKSDYGVVWHDFRSTTEGLLKTIGATNAEAAALLIQVQTNAAFLAIKWDAWFKTHTASAQYASSDDYLVNLRGDLRLLHRVKKPKEREEPLGLLRDVALDLQLKGDNCRNSGDGLGKEIKVRVHTKAGGKEIGGFEVYYVPRGLLDVKSAHDRFPRQSSPTDERILCPGRYAVWAKKKGFTGDPVIQGVGGHGETHLEVDLEVPAE
jgi:hypothetical protein